MTKDIDVLMQMRDGKRQLNKNLVKHFADSDGLNIVKIRGVFMMAGLLSPKTETKEDVLESIKKNMFLLNVFAHRTGFGAGEPVQQKVIEKKKNGAKKT